LRIPAQNKGKAHSAVTSAMVGPFRFGVSTPKLQTCFARPGPQTAFGLSRAIHRASSLRCGAPVHCALWGLAPGAYAPLHSCPRAFRLSQNAASPWRNVGASSQARHFFLGVSPGVVRPNQTFNAPSCKWR
jgi:hypothetical protein